MDSVSGRAPSHIGRVLMIGNMYAIPPAPMLALMLGSMLTTINQAAKQHLQRGWIVFVIVAGLSFLRSPTGREGS